MIGKSLRNWVLLALVLVSLVPLLVAAYQGYHCGRMAVMDLMHSHLVSVVEARHTMIADRLDRRVQGISTLVRLPVVIGLVEEYNASRSPATATALEGILESIQAVGQPYESLTLFDADWQVIESTGRGRHTPAQFSEGDFRARVAASEGVYFDVAHQHDASDVGSHFGIPLRNPAGAEVGFLAANLNLSKDLAPLLQDRSGLLKTGKVFIVDRALQVITEPFPQSTRSAFRATGNAAITVSRDGHGQDVRRYADFLGHEVLGAAMPLPLRDWTVVAEIDTKEAMAWADVLLFRSSLMVGAVLGVVILVSMWLSNLLARPLALLAGIAHRISEGFTGDRLGPMNLQEAEEVRRAVNRMLDDLRDKEDQIVRTATLAIVGELTSSVVHEMRNPLSSIKMNLQALRQCVAGDESNEELAAISERQVRRLENMLNELLQYGRPLELVRESVSVKVLVDTAVNAAAGFASGRDIAVQYAGRLDGKTLYVDVEHMGRAMVNLIQNAVEAAPAGGVEIDVHDSEEPEDGIVIAVRDRGPGIRVEHAGKLFKPFFTTKSDGVGLGLANVKKIVDIHGGRIEARNREGGGAEFHIELPIRLRA